MNGEYSDPFYANIRKTKANTFEITIPKRTIDFEGWLEGDELMCIAKKRVKKSEEN